MTDAELIANDYTAAQISALIDSKLVDGASEYDSDVAVLRRAHRLVG